MPWCCDRFFNRQYDLDQHDNAVHYPWLCDECGTRFCEEDQLDEHIDDEHTTYYYCEICPHIGRPQRKFRSERARDQHVQNASGHENWCFKCKRGFSSPNALKQHLLSSIHNGKCVKCPFCIRMFANLTGITLHLESGTCDSGITRRQIDEYVRKVDSRNVITKKLLTYGDWDNGENSQIEANEQSWNGEAYECYFCEREFGRLSALNQHLNSSVHEAMKYHCPSCRTEFRLLSGLVNHLQSGRCGEFRFKMGQGMGGVGRMVGRMIEF